MVILLQTDYRMEILEVEGAAILELGRFDRRTYEYSKICKSTDLHILLCKHAIIFGLSGSRRIYQLMFCPDVRARRRGAELL